MKVKLSITALALLIASPALAGEAMDKCVSETTGVVADPQGGCACFIEAISDDAAAEYVSISDWESEASDEMKEAGATCFPDV